MKKELFREKAAEKFATAGEIDKLFVVMTPQGWLAIATLFALVIGSLIWAFFGEIPTQVSGKGILMTTRGVFTISSTKEGKITHLNLNTNEWIVEGTTLAVIDGDEIKSPSAGKILELYVKEGDWVKQGDTLAWVQYPLEKGDHYLCYAFFPTATGEKLESGMEAKIAPETIDTATFGFLLGQVKRVSDYPAADRAIYNLIRNREVISLLKGSHLSVVETTIALNIDSATTTGYQWSTGMGPSTALAAGTICDVFVITQTKSPISYLFPVFSKKSPPRSSINPDVFPTNTPEN